MILNAVLMHLGAAVKTVCIITWQAPAIPICLLVYSHRLKIFILHSAIYGLQHDCYHMDGTQIRRDASYSLGGSYLILLLIFIDETTLSSYHNGEFVIITLANARGNTGVKILAKVLP